MQEQKPKTAVEAPENPKNPLNVNVNVYDNEKENGYANENVYDTVDVKEKDNVKDNANEKENGNAKENVDRTTDFFNSLILNDFDDDGENSSFGEGSASAYMEGLAWKELENNYRYSQPLEEEGDTYV